METYIEDYKLYLKTDKNVTDNTVISYMTDLASFSNFFEGDLLQLTPQDIRRYIAHMMELGRSTASINRAKTALKGYYNYLVKTIHVIPKSPMEDIKAGKIEDRLPKFLSFDEMKAILIASRHSDLKDRLVVELLYGLGGRVSEIASLKVEDIDFEECYVTLFGKGRKERYNPLPPSSIALIKDYMAYYDIQSGYLFPNRFDNTKPMTTEGISKMVKRLAKDGGVDPKKVSPHVFRHTFATHLLENGCDMSVIKELMGHENIKTTEVYAKVTKTKKKGALNQYHPLAQPNLL